MMRTKKGTAPALLDGCKVIELKERIEECILTVTSRTLKFNRATARMLGVPEKVELLINEKRLQLAVTPAGADDENGIDFSYDVESREKPILVRNARVMAEVGKLAALEKNGQTVTLQVKGMVYPDDKVVIFDFVEAVENVAKPRAGRRRSKKKDL